MNYISEKELNQIKSQMNDNSEFEIRFYSDTQYEKKNIPGIDLEAFITSIDYMSKINTDIVTIVYSFIVTHKDHTRVSQVLEPPTNGDSLSFPWTNKIINDKVIIKNQVLRKDNCEYGLRFSLSNENLVTVNENTFTSNNPPVYFKVMKRFSYIIGFIQVDITMFKSSDDLDKLTSSNLQYDIEIEVKKECKIEEVYFWIDTILKIINKTFVNVTKSEIKKVKTDYYKLTGKNTFIGCQPVTFRESRLDKNQDYALTLKLDGIRHLLFTNDEGCYLIDNKMNFKCILKEKSDQQYLFDGELFQGKYYIFDILFFNGKDARDLSFTERYLLIKKNVKESDFITVKEYIFDNIYDKIDEYYNESTLTMKDNNVDGFIFVNQSKGYKHQPLKWKPEKMNTIDFKISKYLIDTSYEEWLLLCSNGEKDIPFTFNGDNISKIKVEKNIACNYTNGTVVEFYYDKLHKTFIPLKTRHDKIKGNYIKVAQDNFDTIINPYNLKNLCKTTTSRNESALFNMRRFHNWIKRKLLEKYSIKTGNLLDLACGKGGDIYKWVDNNIRQVQGYDINVDSINDAKRRFSKVITKPTSKAFNYNFEVRDLSKDPCTTSTLYDTASCFFAIHYFYKDISSLKIFTESLRNVKEGGYFIMTTLSSEKLKEIDYTLKNEYVKIVKKNIDPNRKLGNIISVGIKDSVLDIPTEEYIVDYDYTINFMATKSFKLVETNLFKEYYKDWKQNQNFLSSEECEYSFLNRVYIFMKDNTVTESIVSSNVEPVVFEDTNDTILLDRPLKGKNEWKLAELKKYCSDNKLETKGKKEQLFERIKQHINKK